MAALQHTTRRALFAAVPALAAIVALPAIAQPNPSDNLRKFIEWVGVGPALDHAFAAGYTIQDLYCVVNPNKDNKNWVLLFSSPEGTGRFANEGRI